MMTTMMTVIIMHH